MGEYGMVGRNRVKLGTCEDMYYLRAAQVWQVDPEPGNVNPGSPEDRKSIRFRFPWPDEDGVGVGEFKNHDRSVAVHRVELPKGITHYSVQFKSDNGYLFSLPCPEGEEARKDIEVHRNGFAGKVHIVQQAYRNGHLALICRCGGCGAPYNLPTLADAEPVIVACRAEANREGRREVAAKWWNEVADRILAGYHDVTKTEKTHVDHV